MTTKKKQNHGGTRQGSGRPAKPASRKVQVGLKVDPVIRRYLRTLPNQTKAIEELIAKSKSYREWKQNENSTIVDNHNGGVDVTDPATTTKGINHRPSQDRFLTQGRGVMALFEIATGYIGCSFERCYVWTESRERAEALFRQHYADREIKGIATVLHLDDGEFITTLDDEGIGLRSAR